MVFNFEGRHSGDVIMAMPVITSLLKSGVDIKVYVDTTYRNLLNGFNLSYNNSPEGEDMSDISKINYQITEYWLRKYNVHPYRHEFKIEKSNPKIIISPDSRDFNKRMPKEFWEDVVKYCDGDVVMVGPKDAINYNKSLNLHVIDLTGTDTIPELYSYLNNARAVITTDTAISHLSDALNSVTITAFNQDNYKLFAPFWNPHIALTSRDVKDYLNKLI
jgi:ADP-heptose:LPS heptosyltransferase